MPLRQLDKGAARGILGKLPRLRILGKTLLNVIRELLQCLFRILSVTNDLTVCHNNPLLRGNHSIMLRTPYAIRATAGIHQKLDPALVLDLINKIKVAVQILIQHHKIIILLQLLVQLVNVLDLLTSRAVMLIAWVLLANVFFQNGRQDHDLIHAIVAHLHAKVTIRIRKILLKNNGVRKGVTNGDPKVVNTLHRITHHVLGTLHAIAKAPAIPKGSRELTKKRSNLHALVEKLRFRL